MTSDDIKNAAKDTAERIGRASEDAKSSAKGAAAKAGDAAREFAARASDTAGDLYDRVPDSASDALAAGQQAYRKSSHTVARQVVKQPIEALLLAGAIGYLVGWATNRS